jgi:hypothetical protein
VAKDPVYVPSTITFDGVTVGVGDGVLVTLGVAIGLGDGDGATTALAVTLDVASLSLDNTAEHEYFHVSPTPNWPSAVDASAIKRGSQKSLDTCTLVKLVSALMLATDTLIVTRL